MMARFSLLVALLCFLGVQIALHFASKPIKAYWETLPPVPSERDLNASAFGDREFLYRVLALQLQNFGDGGGRITPLKDYDMESVADWLGTLDKLDLYAQYHVVLAMRYFSQTQDHSQLIHIIRWLQNHVAANPERKQWWLASAIMLSSKRLNDLNLSLALAEQLASYDFPNTKLEAFLYPAFIHEQLGNFDIAAAIARDVAERYADRFPPGEINWSKNYANLMDNADWQWRRSGGMGPVLP